MLYKMSIEFCSLNSRRVEKLPDESWLAQWLERNSRPALKFVAWVQWQVRTHRMHEKMKEQKL